MCLESASVSYSLESGHREMVEGGINFVHESDEECVRV